MNEDDKAVEDGIAQFRRFLENEQGKGREERKSDYPRGGLNMHIGGPPNIPKPDNLRNKKLLLTK